MKNTRPHLILHWTNQRPSEFSPPLPLYCNRSIVSAPPTRVQAIPIISRNSQKDKLFLRSCPIWSLLVSMLDENSSLAANFAFFVNYYCLNSYWRDIPLYEVFFQAQKRSTERRHSLSMVALQSSQHFFLVFLYYKEREHRFCSLYKSCCASHSSSPMQFSSSSVILAAAPISLPRSKISLLEKTGHGRSEVLRRVYHTRNTLRSLLLRKNDRL